MAFTSDPIVFVFGGQPSGLTMSPSGLISGTPIFTGTCDFNVYVKTASGSCFKSLTLTIDPTTDGPDWGKICWDQATTAIMGNDPNIVAGIDPYGNSCLAFCKGGYLQPTDFGADDASGRVGLHGTLAYTGPSKVCMIVWALAPYAGATVGIMIKVNGLQLASPIHDLSMYSSPFYFTLPDCSAGATIEVEGYDYGGETELGRAYGASHSNPGTSPGQFTVFFEVRNKN
jgi:hypothetical protein